MFNSVCKSSVCGVGVSVEVLEIPKFSSMGDNCEEVEREK